MIWKTFRSAAIIYALTVLTVSGCADRAPAEKPSGSTEDPELVFIDIDSFDKHLLNAMEDSTEDVTVRFTGQSVTPNDIPERMQKWLSTADSKGKGLSMKSNDGVENKSIMALLPLLPTGYEMLKNAYTVSVVSDYGVTLYYDPQSAVIDRVVFSK